MIETTATQRAAQVAMQLGNLANGLVKQHVAFSANGLPAQGNLPAVTAAQYLAALGTAQQAVLDAIAAANPQS